jgi:hypothetical protein
MMVTAGLTRPALVVSLESVLRMRLGFAAYALAAIDKAGDTTNKAAKKVNYSVSHSA